MPAEINEVVIVKYVRLVLLATLSLLALGAAPARAQIACVFDIMGAQGDVYALARD